MWPVPYSQGSVIWCPASHLNMDRIYENYHQNLFLTLINNALIT